MALEDFTTRRTDLVSGDSGRVDDTNMVHDALNEIVPLLLTDGRLSTAQLQELIRDTVAAALVEGTNVTITPDDDANSLTIASTAGGGGSTDALVPLKWTGSEWPARTDTNHQWQGGVLATPPPNIATDELWVKDVEA